MLTYKTDPLLWSREHKYVIKNTEQINVYRALIWKQDFNKYWSRTTPYIKNKEVGKEICKILLKISNNDLNKIVKQLAMLIEKYVHFKYMSNCLIKSLAKQIHTGRINLVVLRCLSLFFEKFTRRTNIDTFVNFLNKIDCIYDYKGKTTFKLPLNLSQAIKNKIIYLVGAVYGDGCISKNDQHLWICDGFRREDKLHYSLEYLQLLARLIREEFSINYKIRRKKNENTYELMTFSKWFGRYFHEIYDIPIGRKYSKLRVPVIFQKYLESNNVNKLCLFWRGVLDTDGSIPSHREILLGSKNREFLKEFENLLIKLKIKNSGVRSAANLNYYISILVKNYYIFAKKIGTSHPRKIINLLSNLEKGPTNRLFYGAHNLFGNYFDLELLQNDLRVSNVNMIFRDFRLQLGKSQKELAKFLGYKVYSSINRLERGKRGIVLRDFIKLARDCGYDKEYIYHVLSKPHVRYSAATGSNISCRLPIIYTKEIVNLLKFLHPIESINKIYVVTSCSLDELSTLRDYLS